MAHSANRAHETFPMTMTTPPTHHTSSTAIGLFSASAALSTIGVSLVLAQHPLERAAVDTYNRHASERGCPAR